MVSSQRLDLVAHMEWADAKVWQAVLGSDAARTDAKILGWLQHLHAVQRGFLTLWRGEWLPPKPPDFSDPLALATWAHEGHVEVHAFLADIDPSVSDRVLSLPWAAVLEESLKRPAEAVTIGQTALQVVLHSTHHRAQVNARLRDLGAEPPAIDFIVWLWLGRPPADWTVIDAGSAV